MNMNKYKFAEHTWLTFEYNSIFHVGRTILINEVEQIASVAENGQISHIPYGAISNPKKLRILKSAQLVDCNTDKKRVGLNLDTSSN